MRQAGLAGVSRRRGPRTTIRDARLRPASDLVDRNFFAEKPDVLWVADITYVPTWAGFLYLAVVLDAFSRRIVGWAMGTDLKTDLVLDALNMAVQQRRPGNVIHHSDQGSQYTSVAFGLRCKEAGVRPSMGSVGDAYDNAMCESFFATLECELLQRRKFQTKAEARMGVFVFIEGWYNPSRRHSALGYQSPIEYERANAKPTDAESV
jgi:putative transposase